MTEALSVLLGAGGLGILAALVKAWRDIKSGKKADERDTITDLEALRKSAIDSLQQVTVERDYYRDWAGEMSFQLAQLTGKVPEKPPYPTHERN